MSWVIGTDQVSSVIPREPELITHSRMAAFRGCERLHQIRYVRGYRPLVVREELAFGTLMHAGLEGWWTSWIAGTELHAEAAIGYMLKARTPNIDDATFAKAETVMLAYDTVWTPSMADVEVLAVEAQFNAPLFLASGRPMPGVRQGGMIDVLIRKPDGLVYMVEHKTTGSDITPGSAYWAKLRMEPQVSMYHEGARALGYELAGCIYDVLVRPKHSLLKATPAETRKYTKEGKLYANQRDQDETAEEFRSRLVAVIAEDPKRWFARADVVRLDTELEDFREDVRETARRIRTATRQKTPAPRNPDYCHKFGRACEFWDVCTGTADLDDETRFRKVENVHEELKPKEEA